MTSRFRFAVAPMMLLAALVSTTTVMADDDLLSKLASSEMDTTENIADIDDADLGLADVESLMNDGEAVDQEEAVAACYRRFGRSYGYRSYGHRSYGYSNFGYSSCYSRSYYPSYNHYSPSYCYTPVTYSYCTPVYNSYWGCW